MENLQGKIAVVTGASMGIGFGIATALAKAGCHVALLARGKEALDKAASSLKGLGLQASVYPCDLNDNQQIKITITKIQQELGDIDILVNNAGVGTFKPMTQMTFAEALAPIQLPFGAAIAASHCVLPRMVERKSGHIVNLTSPAGYFPLPYMMPYTAARHAMVGLSNSLWQEFHDQGIGVTIICPSQVNTGYFTRNDADMGWYPRLTKYFPVLEPDQVGANVVKAIKEDRKELIFPPILWFLTRWYQLIPNCTFWFLKLIGLLKPSKLS